MELTQNPSVLELVRKTAELTTPKEIVWIDGSDSGCSIKYNADVINLNG